MIMSRVWKAMGPFGDVWTTKACPAAIMEVSPQSNLSLTVVHMPSVCLAEV